MLSVSYTVGLKLVKLTALHVSLLVVLLCIKIGLCHCVGPIFCLSAKLKCVVLFFINFSFRFVVSYR